MWPRLMWPRLMWPRLMWPNLMTRSMNGIVTIVQEGRFQMTDDDGVSHLFMLSHSASAEPQQLVALQARQARVRVRYKPAPGLIGNIATAISVDE
jgi:hypothetical protein